MILRHSRRRSSSVGQFASSITQYGITWTFDQPRQVGQFISGDWWVRGPLTITSVSPGWQAVTLGNANGSMLDLVKGAYQGFVDFPATNWLPYSATVRATFPLSVGSGTHSLISTVGTMAGSVSHSAITDAAVLTITDESVPPDAFRPAYTGPKTIWRWSDVNTGAVPSLALPSGATLAPTTGTDSLERWWLDMCGNSQIGVNVWRQFIIPTNHADWYPAYRNAAAIDVALSALIRSADNSNRDQYLKRALQLGIDYWGIDQAGTQNIWTTNGGHGTGAKWAVLMAGALINGSGITASAYASDFSASIPRYSEDGFCYSYSGSARWGADPSLFDMSLPFFNNHVYRGSAGEEPEPGAGILPSGTYAWEAGKHYYVGECVGGDGATNSAPIGGKSYRCKTEITSATTQPTGTGSSIADGGGSWEYLAPRVAFGGDYQQLNSYIYPGMMLVALQLGFKSAWANNAFFDYTDRWVSENKARGFPVGDGVFISNLAKKMWSAYR